MVSSRFIFIFAIGHSFAQTAEEPQLCTKWPQSDCKVNSCANDVACGPSLKCKDNECQAKTCENFGDEICPTGGFRCLGNGCVQQDFQCDKFQNQCFNISLVCLDTKCIYDPNYIPPVDGEPTEPEAEPENGQQQQRWWVALVALPITLILLSIWLFLARKFDSNLNQSQIPFSGFPVIQTARGLDPMPAADNISSGSETIVNELGITIAPTRNELGADMAQHSLNEVSVGEGSGIQRIPTQHREASLEARLV